MHFEYRGFKIEGATTDGGAGFIGIATIYQPSADGGDRKMFTSGSLTSFPTHLQAVNFARVWAEIWCDGQLTRHGRRISQRCNASHPKNATKSRKSLLSVFGQHD
jgi:hypothetical protein